MKWLRKYLFLSSKYVVNVLIWFFCDVLIGGNTTCHFKQWSSKHKTSAKERDKKRSRVRRKVHGVCLVTKFVKKVRIKSPVLCIFCHFMGCVTILILTAHISYGTSLKVQQDVTGCREWARDCWRCADPPRRACKEDRFTVVLVDRPASVSSITLTHWSHRQTSWLTFIYSVTVSFGRPSVGLVVGSFPLSIEIFEHRRYTPFRE